MKNLIKLALFMLLVVGCKTEKKESKVAEKETATTKEVTLQKFDNLACKDTLGIDLPSNCNNIEVKKPFEGMKNFREVTLLPNNPIQIKKDILFRSDALHNLTESDVQKMEGMNIKTIVDLRHDMEIEEDPDQAISGTKNINLPIGRDPSKLDNLIDDATYKKIRRLFIDGKMKEVDELLANINLDMEEAREDRYRSFANNFKPQLSELMKLLADKNNLPLVFHCQGGKDRTGFASALILKTLGADNETVVNDYLTTNIYDYKNIAKKYMSGSERLKPAFGAHKKQMQVALKAVEDEYGSFDNYLKKGLNLTDAEIKSIRHNLKK